MPTELRKRISVKLPKKGKLTECNCWREIALLSLPSKKFSRIILDRIKYAIGIGLRQQQVTFVKIVVGLTSLTTSG
jgi:hypothetical protein